MEGKSGYFDFIWVINGWEGFGISRATISLAQEMRNNDKSILFISVSPGGLEDNLKQLGFKVLSLDLKSVTLFNEKTFYFLSKSIKNIRRLTKTYLKIKRSIAKYSYDVLLYGSANLTPFVSLLGKQGVKIFLMHNTISKNYFLNLNKYLYLIACSMGSINIVGNSYYTASTLASKNTKFYVLHLGVEDQDFVPNKVVLPREDFAISEEDIVYGIFARFDYAKAQDLVIEAFSKLVAKYPSTSFKLLLIGLKDKNPFYHNCVSLIDELELKERVTILESKENIVPFYSLVNVMINSRRDAEPFGLTIVESMLMKIPVIALALGGPSETILEDETGWLIKSPTVEHYFTAMDTSFQMKDEWKKMGEKGRKHALQNYTTATVHTKLLKIIEEIKK